MGRAFAQGAAAEASMNNGETQLVWLILINKSKGKESQQCTGKKEVRSWSKSEAEDKIIALLHVF